MNPSQTMSFSEEFTARALKEAYAAKMRARVGRKFDFTDRYRAVQNWLSAAQLCNLLQANPALFIEAQFANEPAHGVFPNSLSGEWARKNYERYVITRGIQKSAQVQPGTAESIAVASLTSDEDLNMELSTIRHTLQGYYGHMDLGSRDALVLLQQPGMAFSAHLRVLLFPEDPFIWEQYSLEAAQILASNHLVTDACRRASLPVDQVLARMQSRSPHHG